MNNVDWRQILGVMKMKGENEGKIMFFGSENRNLGMRIATPSREREREIHAIQTQPPQNEQTNVEIAYLGTNGVKLKS